MADDGSGYDFGDPGVPVSEGESWGETADRLRSASIDLSCPNGCFELEVSGEHATRDPVGFLKDVAIQDEPGSCPNCGEPIRGGDK